MPYSKPGFDVQRTARLVREVVAELALDLTRLTVLTEAATGPFAVTAVLAACAGAREVFCVARDSQFGSTEEAFEATRKLALAAGVKGRMTYFADKTEELVAQADIITNTRHLRPLDHATVGWMHELAVVPLMYEGWEHRLGDVDRAACEARGIPLVGTNERDSRIGVFDYLGPASARLLNDAGFEVLGSRVLLVCNNPFAPFIKNYLEAAGTAVSLVPDLADELPEGPFDAVMLAAKPTGRDIVGPAEAEQLARAFPGTCLVQFWGDVNRAELAGRGLAVWPLLSPGRGRMGILLSDLGPMPAVRLQAGGLKVGEILARTRADNPGPSGCKAAIDAALASGFGSPLYGQTMEMS